MDYCVSLLAKAIVGQAVKDYVAAKARMINTGVLHHDNLAEARVAECTRFFKSQWFSDLSDLDPEVLIGLCDEQAKLEAQNPKGKFKKRITFVVSMDP